MPSYNTTNRNIRRRRKMKQRRHEARAAGPSRVTERAIERQAQIDRIVGTIKSHGHTRASLRMLGREVGLTVKEMGNKSTVSDDELIRMIARRTK